jgi:LysM repeat protein
VRLAVREVVTVVMAAGVRVLDDYSWADVEPVLRATVLRTLGFARQELGQPAYLSTVVGAMQAVPGVDFVDVDVFKGVESDTTPLKLLVVSRSLDAPDPCVPARLAAYAKRLHTVAPGDTLTSIAHTNGLTLDQLVALNPRAVRLVETGAELRLFEGIRPAQLAVLPAALPEALSLRRIR